MASSAAVQRFGKLPSVEQMTFECMEVCGELDSMQHWSALRDLKMVNCDLKGQHLLAPVSARQALGRLTMLTKLEMESCGYAKPD